MADDAKTARAVILLDHGSREPEANQHLEALAAQVAQRLPGRRVRCAHLSVAAPTLAEAAGECVRAGAREVTVVPCFIAPGRHVRVDLPRLVADLRAAHLGVSFRLAEPLGADPRLADALAARATESEDSK